MCFCREENKIQIYKRHTENGRICLVQARVVNGVDEEPGIGRTDREGRNEISVSGALNIQRIARKRTGRGRAQRRSIRERSPFFLSVHLNAHLSKSRKSKPMRARRAYWFRKKKKINKKLQSCILQSCLRTDDSNRKITLDRRKKKENKKSITMRMRLFYFTQRTGSRIRTYV